MSAPAQALNILRGARLRLTQRGWTQGTMFRDAAGNAVRTGHLWNTKLGNPRSEPACLCLAGAVRSAAMTARILTRSPARAVTLDDAEEMAMRALATAAGMSVSAWNDATGRTLSDVLALLDLAVLNFRKEHLL